MKRTRGADTNGRGGVNVLVRMAALAITLSVAAYTTGHPGKNLPWLGLATQDGRYEVLLGDGCEQIGADMNVRLERSDDTNEAQWALRLPDADQACSVAEWHWVGNLPCAQNPDNGDCDVEHA